jgi:hypothetical protein
MPRLNREQRAIFLSDDVIRTVQAMEAVSGASGQRGLLYERESQFDKNGKKYAENHYIR